jgi:hypothetical protein
MEMKECYRIHGRHGNRNRSGRENHEIHGGTRKESAREWRESGEWVGTELAGGEEDDEWPTEYTDDTEI